MGERPDIYSPDLYATGPPHELFANLRNSDPVCWQEVPDEAGYWAVLRHADIVEVSRQPALYSASEGGVVIEDPGLEQLESMRRMLLAMDPPAHGEYRRPLAPSFRGRVIAAMEPQVRAVCAEILEKAADQGEVEFVHDVAAGVPSMVFGRLMGLPDDDMPHLHQLAEEITSGQDPDIAARSAGGPGPAIEMAMYAIEFAGRLRSKERKQDLAGLLLSTEFAGAPMDDITFGSFFVQMVTAGNDTTKTILSAGLLTLLEHPDQLAELRDDPGLIPEAVEEILRYDNPLHYFRRTAMADCVLAGTKIQKGDKVAMMYTSANRDETVFADPQAFDIHRRPNPHLAFGIGEHFCLGSHLARLEARVFFEELLRSFRAIEVVAPPVRLRSNLNNAYKSVPIRLVA